MYRPAPPWAVPPTGRHLDNSFPVVPGARGHFGLCALYSRRVPYSLSLLLAPYRFIYMAPVRSEVDRALMIFGLEQRATGRLPFPKTETPDGWRAVRRLA